MPRFLHSRFAMPFSTRNVPAAMTVSGLTLCALVVPSALGADNFGANHFASTASATPAGDNVVITEVYGGGGNSGATLTHDFIELYNPTSKSISLAGWAVQYLAANGTTASATVTLSGEIAPGGYYLIQGAKGAGGSTSFSFDAHSDQLAMSGTKGSVVLTKTSTKWSKSDEAVDIVGFGQTETAEGTSIKSLNNTTSASRMKTGVDSDDNARDFTTGAPSPRFSGGDAIEGGRPSSNDDSESGIATKPGKDADSGAGAENGGDSQSSPSAQSGQESRPSVKTPIADIQGTGETSPMLNKSITTTGWVTAAYPTGGLKGFVIQTGGTGGAAREAGEASQAIFVYTGDRKPGDIDKCVVVTGTVTEFKTSTQINGASVKESQNPATDCGDKPRAIVDDIPTDPAQREANEHMLFQPRTEYTVTNNYDVSSFGSVDLVAGDKPLFQATQKVAPGEAAKKYEEDNLKRVITLDDGATRNYFLNKAAKNVPLPYLSTREGIRSLRTGDKVKFQNPAVLSFNFDKWSLQPTGEITGVTERGKLPIAWEDSRVAEAGGPRDVGGELSIASFNVLNYFTDLGKDEKGCKAYTDRNNKPVTAKNCQVRGAYSQQAFENQQAKIVVAINKLNVSVLGLEEIENSAKFGHDRDESLKHLVEALNAAGGHWKYVPSPKTVPADEDVIRTAFIYNPDKVTPEGESRILEHQAFNGIARQPLAQEFRTAGSNESFVAVVNHYKSKGSVARGDADTGDGQGNNANLRRAMSEQLRKWLSEQKDWKDKAQFVMGDFNAYAKEDAIRVLEEGGFTNLDTHFDAGLSYQFGGRLGSLDHVLANSAAMKLVTGADVWDINSDEAASFEYSRRNYNAVDFYAPDVFRASDHDPIKVGFKDPSGASNPSNPANPGEPSESKDPRNPGGPEAAKPGANKSGTSVGSHVASKEFFWKLIAGAAGAGAVVAALYGIGKLLGWVL